jgi:transcriptional regulator with XRE-family HTH domain
MRNPPETDLAMLDAQLSGLGARLSLARRHRRLRQRELAQLVGVTVVTLRKLERGHGGVSLATAVKALVAVGLGAELERLCRGHNREQARSHKAKAGAAVPQPAT